MVSKDKVKKMNPRLEEGNYESYKKYDVPANQIYWSVMCHPDLTEGRGFRKTIFVKTIVCSPYIRRFAEKFLMEYLLEAFGKPIEDVMGMQPTENWEYQQIEEETEIPKNQELVVLAIGLPKSHFIVLPNMKYKDTEDEVLELKSEIEKLQERIKQLES
jgi:hypothetical protein